MDERAAVEQVITRRRTNLRVDPERSVPVDVVEELCALAVWAPNHKGTEPWRFALFTGAGRARLGAALADGMVAAGLTDEAKLAKARTKYLRAPAVLVVACIGNLDDPHRHAEDRDAVAAAVQNVLLGASAMGLASFWSSAHPAALGEVKALAGWEADDDVVALVYLGWPIGEVPVPARTAPQLAVIDE
jgi:nitroreductase